MTNEGEGVRLRKDTEYSDISNYSERGTTEYGSAAKYAAAIKNYIFEYQKWEIAYKALHAQQSSFVHHAHHHVSPPVNHPAPQAAAHPQNLAQANQNPTVTAVGAFEPATLMRRITAECIDFFLCLAIKLVFLLILVEYDLVDVDPYQKVIDENHDIIEFISMTQALLPIELGSKIICAILEGIVMSYNIGPCKRGQTPGKWIVGIRVLHAEQVTESQQPNHVTLHNPTELTMRQAIVRSLLKNMIVNSLFPFSTVAFNLSQTRSFYDAALKTIVVFG